MAITILGVFNTEAVANQALDDLRAGGIALIGTSIVTHDKHGAAGGSVRHASKAMLIVKINEETALDVRRIMVHAGANTLHENETDMLNWGASEVMQYSELGGPSEHGVITEGDPVVAPVAPNTMQVASTDKYDRGIASGHELDLDEGTPPEEVLAEDESDSATHRPGKSMENGARVVSYEEEQKLRKPG